MRYDGIVFDFGNTLVPWGDKQSRTLYAAVHETMTARVGPMPGFFLRALKIRNTLVHERRYTTMRELTVAELVDAFFDDGAPPGLADEVAETIHAAFLRLARVPDGVADLLARLGRRRPLAVLSNFLMTAPVEDILKRDGLWGLFVHVEVSATHGLMKPHPAPFELVREKLGTPMERTLMVGDEFWADVVGGHRAGFLTALTQEHARGPTKDARVPEVRADRILLRLDELDEVAGG